MNKYRYFIILLSCIFTWHILFAKTLKRIISLAPSITENLYALGLEENVIGVTVYCPEYIKKNKAVIGTLLEPNFEKIVALHPDIVIADKESNNPAAVNKLKKLHINVFVNDYGNNFEGICTSLIVLGRELEKEEKAKEIVASVKNKLILMKHKNKRNKSLKVFWEIGAAPLYTIGKYSFLNDINNYAGTINIFSDLALKYTKISREEVVLRNPEAIFILVSKLGKSEQEYWKNFKNIDAVKNNKIYFIESADIQLPTPMTFLKAVEKVSELINE